MEHFWEFAKKIKFWVGKLWKNHFGLVEKKENVGQCTVYSNRIVNIW